MTKTLIIGIGGAGTNISQFLVENLNGSYEWLLINSDKKSLAKHPTTNSIFLDLALSAKPTIPKKFADAVQGMKSEISSHIQGKEQVVIVAGLGGESGTYSMPSIAQLAGMHSDNFTLICVLPFKFEESRRRLAEQELTTLKSTFPNQVVEFDNHSIMDKKLSLTEAFQQANDTILTLLNQQMSANLIGET